MIAAVVPLLVAAAAATAAPNPIQTENALGGTQPSEWSPPPTPPTAIEGWASEVSVLPGQQVHLHVSTNDGDRYRVELYRLGWYGGGGAGGVTGSPRCGGAGGGGAPGAAPPTGRSPRGGAAPRTPFS